MLLKIGDFARLSRVSVKTLRYYDEIGLLTSSEVDPFTNYRYYTVDQLARIHRIMALKELGLSLEQIKQMLDSDLSLEQIQGMFELRKGELQQHVEETQARLAQVQFRLRMLKVEDQMPTIDIQVREVAPFAGLTDHQRSRLEPDTLNLGSGSQAGAARGRMYLEALSKYKLPLNPPVAIYYDLDFEAEYLESKTILPLDAKPDEEIVLSDNSVMQWETIPGLPMAASYFFNGPYDQVPEQLLVVERWMAENGYRRGEQSRAIFHRGPMHFGPQNEFVTEVQIEILPKSEEAQQ